MRVRVCVHVCVACNTDVRNTRARPHICTHTRAAVAYYADIDTRNGGAGHYKVRTDTPALGAVQTLLQLSTAPEYVFVAAWLDCA